MADGMGAMHSAEPKPLGNLLRAPYFLEQGHALAAPHNLDGRRLACEPFVELSRQDVADADHRVGVVQHDLGVAEGSANAVGQLFGCVGRSGAQGDLSFAASALAKDGEARTVGPAIRQRSEHGFGQTAKLWLERRVFQEEADNAAHRREAPGKWAFTMLRRRTVRQPT